MNIWLGNLWQTADSERKWALALAAGVLLLGGLTLGPALFPSPRVPTITRQTLAPVAAAPSADPAPVYPRTASVQPLISGRLNLNTATSEQLEALPEVGPSMAALIVKARPLRSLADLDAIKGVGESTLKALTPLVSF
ncbi:MAG: competence protein ComEA [Deinococcus sp.]|nr:competence protein ComEA [Deinococcus sp.]